MTDKIPTMTLSAFRFANMLRARESFGHGKGLTDWSPAEWGNALAGEVGELCNLLKKLRRGERVDPQWVGDEIHDVDTYLDLVSARLGYDRTEVALRKWNKVSEKVESDLRLDVVGNLVIVRRGPVVIHDGLQPVRAKRADF